MDQLDLEVDLPDSELPIPPRVDLVLVLRRELMGSASRLPWADLALPRRYPWGSAPRPALVCSVQLFLVLGG